MTNNTNSQGEQILRAALRLVEEHPGGKMAHVLHRLFAPYCAEIVGDYVLPLNRQYKPLGVPPGVIFVNYDDYLQTHGIPLADLPPSVAASPRTYLYKEGSSEPWAGERYLHAYLVHVEEFFDL